MKIKILITTTDNRDTAETIAKILIEKKLSACIQIIPGIISLYPWQGSLENSKEFYLQIKTKPELIKNAPHTQEDVCDWNYDYTIEEACYPNFEENGKSISSKYWPTVNRVDDTYGDKELMKRFK